MESDVRVSNPFQTKPIYWNINLRRKGEEKGAYVVEACLLLHNLLPLEIILIWCYLLRELEMSL